MPLRSKQWSCAVQPWWYIFMCQIIPIVPEYTKIAPAQDKRVRSALPLAIQGATSFSIVFPMIRFDLCDPRRTLLLHQYLELHRWTFESSLLLLHRHGAMQGQNPGTFTSSGMDHSFPNPDGWNEWVTYKKFDPGLLIIKFLWMKFVNLVLKVMSHIWIKPSFTTWQMPY